MNNDVEINDLTTLGDLAIWLHDNGWVASNDAQWTRVAPLWNELDHLRAEVARLTAEIVRIADDYYADYEEDAPLALSEMREALTALLVRETTVKDEDNE